MKFTKSTCKKRTKPRTKRAKIKRRTKRRTKRLTKRGGGNTGSSHSNAHTPLTECPVCLENKELCQMSPCNHEICSTCFNQLTNQTCPLCRTVVESLTCNGHIVWNSMPFDRFVESVAHILGENWEIVNQNQNRIELPNGHTAIFDMGCILLFKYTGTRWINRYNRRELNHLLRTSNVVLRNRIIPITYEVVRLDEFGTYMVFSDRSV